MQDNTPAPLAQDVLKVLARKDLSQIATALGLSKKVSFVAKRSRADGGP